MKTIFNMILVLITSMSGSLLYAQNTITFGYDAAGNCVSRTITITTQKVAPMPVAETAVVYSEMLSDIQIKIYPNPTDGLLKVEIQNLSESQIAEIRLYNLSGRLIIAQKAIEGTSEIDISDQPAGIYVMKIMAGEYQTEWRIIKK